MEKKRVWRVKGDVELGRYKGVKGWLLFLCIYLTILNPLLYVFAILINFDQYTGVHGFSWDFFFGRNIPGMETYRIMSIGVDGYLLIFGIVAGILLWKVKSKSIKVAKSFFLTMLLLSLFSCNSSSILAAAACSALHIFVVNILNFVKAMIVFSIWFIYLYRSKRIRATYPDDC